MIARTNGSSPGAALVLAAHGSSDDPRCAAPVRRHARRLAARGEFCQVLCIFWRQRPHFRELGSLTDRGHLVIVPVMTAAGYYVNTVLPRELARDERLAGRTVEIAPPIGVLDGMAGMIRLQALEAAREHGLDPATCRLLVIGHGTPRDALGSGASTWRHARTLSRRRLFRSVHAAFLDQFPPIDGVVASLPGPEPIVVVPHLIADGGHARDDVPRRLGGEPGARMFVRDGRTIVLASAAGERPECAEMILRAALSPLRSRVTLSRLRRTGADPHYDALSLQLCGGDTPAPSAAVSRDRTTALASGLDDADGADAP